MSIAQTIPSVMQNWAPSVLLLASSILIFLSFRGKEKHEDPSGEELPSVDVHRPHFSLREALDGIEKSSPYRMAEHSGPSVRLGEVSKFTPSDYENSAMIIARRFREGRVVSIDLSYLDEGQAVRLVDFCHGMLAFSSGWVFRVTQRVLMLVPGS